MLCRVTLRQFEISCLQRTSAPPTTEAEDSATIEAPRVVSCDGGTVDDSPAVGPYETFPLQSGNAAPLYLITFDKNGQCQSPLTLAHLLQEAGTGKYTDVHLCSHGWNNVFKDAVHLYREFFGLYFQLRDQLRLNDPAGYRPLVIGVIWPSTWIVLPWEATPKIAALPSAAERDEAATSDQQILQEVALEVEASQAQRLYELVERGATLQPHEARELAGILLPVYQRSARSGSQTEIGDSAPSELTADDLLALWRKISPSPPTAAQRPGFARETTEPELRAAGGPLTWLDPRGPVRVASVLVMKDRAGVVGYDGVGPRLLHKLLGQNLRVHAIGHSFGCKVMLSALCCRSPVKLAASLLLLQPAISYLCFGDNIDGKGRTGGYRAALKYVQKPIYSTFSSHDVPLTKLFHLAVVRDSDWGEIRIAGVPPSKFAALGGFGPGGLKTGESNTVDVTAPGTKYPDHASYQVVALNGSGGQIKGHGDIATQFTAWAHLNLVSGEQL
jgi:hypothetical protein